MANLGSLYATLELNTAQLTKRVGEVERQLKTFSNNTKNSFSKIGTAIKGFFLGVVIAAITKAVNMAVEGLQSIFTAAKEFGQLTKTFNAITGSAEKTGETFAFIRDVSDRMGQNFYDLTGSYKSLLAASRGSNLEGQKTRDIFEGIIRASASLGLSSEQTRGALNAVQQMMSKGNVQAEELRGQLGERLPGAFNLAAEAMGKTTQELNKMLDNGEVLASDLLPKLAKLLKERYTGEVSKAVEASNKFKEAWLELKTSMASGGFLDAISESMMHFAEVMKDPSVQEGLKNIINMVGATAKAMANLAQSTAGWAAVFRGELDFTEFATMNAKELNEWLKQNRSETSRITNEIQKLQDQVAKEINFAWLTPEAQAARDARLKELYKQIDELQMKLQSATSASAYSGMFDNLGLEEVIKDITEVKKELTTPFDNIATLEGFQKTVKEMNEYYEEAAKERIDIHDDESEKLLSAEKEITENMIKFWASVFQAQIDSQQEATKNFQGGFLFLENFMKTHGEKLAKYGARSLTDSLFDFIEGTKSAADAFKDFATSFLKYISRMIIQQMIFNALKNSSFGQSIGLTEGAKGLVTSNGHITKMAKGGLITGPTLFGAANGTVLAGEAGTEAIMPLNRDSQGRLGVVSSGNSNGIKNIVVQLDNKSSNQLQASNATVVQSGEDMILKIVIEGYKNNTNNFRDIIGR